MPNRIYAITLLIAIGNFAFAQEPAADQHALDESALLERLQSGGLVLVFRHGETGPDSDRPNNDERQRLISTAPAEGSNRILVSHGYVVGSIVPNPQWPDERGQIARGHAHVLDPLGDGDFIVLADLGPDDWMRLADALSMARAKNRSCIRTLSTS